MSYKKDKKVLTKTINIGNRLIGDNQSCYIIAEIGINHNGSIEIARQLIKKAAECGADAVKFQKRNLANLYQKQHLKNPYLSQRPLQYIMSLHNEIELSGDEYRLILEYCREYSIQFLCTPFDKKSVDFLEKLHVPAYKIGSPDMNNFDLLEYVCSKKKPLIVSTGMSTLPEIEKTVNFLKKKNAEFILLHCNSNYPAPFHDINLRFMLYLKNRFSLPVGYSGHEYGIAISSAAVALGACVIERHFTLDRTMIGPDHAASLEPTGLTKLIRDIRFTEEAMGTGIRYLDQGEYMNKQILGKSLIATCDIKINNRITRKMIAAKSPASGISPQRIDELIGKIAFRNIKVDEQFIETDITGKQKSKFVQKFKFQHPYGIVVRPHEFTEFYRRFSPGLVEFHLTDKDIISLESGFIIKGKYPCELVIHAPEYWEHDLINYSSEDKRIRSISIDVLRRVINIAHKLKRSFNNQQKVKIVIHPGGMYQFSSEHHEFEKDKKYYRILAATLGKIDKQGIELLLENVAPLPWYFGGQWLHTIFLDSLEIIEFCRMNKYSICLDISHAALYCNLKNIDLYSHVEKLLPYAKYLHVADAAGVDGEGLQIGEGSIDFLELAKLFKKYKGSFIPEIWQGHQNTGQGFLEGLIRLQKLNIL